MKSLNLIIIGLGLHAQKAYLPTLYKYKEQFNLNIKLGIDLKTQENSIKKYLTVNKMDINPLFIDPFEYTEGELPFWLEIYLTAFVKDKDIQGIIISTEPLYHKIYAKWALKVGLNILMDKPVSTRKNVTTDFNEAEGIYKDYQELRLLYNKLQENKETIFSINVQRRYHPGFRKVMSLIKEAVSKFDAPVTSIQSSHSDGQWRMPSEIVDQLYHPYFQGYGKCSHSGYHLFDIAYQFYKAGYIEQKYANKVEVMSSFVQPRSFIKQFNETNYENYFGTKYLNEKKYSDETLNKLFKGYGEIDASMILRFMNEDNNICNTSINLLHNSFARRDWVKPGDDLYKGNGRVKHESHVIQQGPFQCIQIHSYQSNDKHTINTIEDDLWGGNNHFDICVFRNSGMFNNKEAPMQSYKLRDKDLFKDYESNCLVHNIAKEFVILEFIRYLRKEVSKKDLLSNFDDHLVPVQIMSSVYKSHIQYVNKASPIVEFNMQSQE